MNASTAVAERILELCKECNYSINFLATESGMKQSTLNDIVSGKTKNPGIITLKKICDGMDKVKKVTLYDFFNTDTFRNLEQEIK